MAVLSGRTLRAVFSICFLTSRFLPQNHTDYYGTTGGEPTSPVQPQSYPSHVDPYHREQLPYHAFRRDVSRAQPPTSPALQAQPQPALASTGEESAFLVQNQPVVAWLANSVKFIENSTLSF